MSHVSNYADTRAFVNDFVANGNVATFIHKLEQSCELTKTLLGGDTGGIGGSSVDGGPVRTAKSVVPDIYYPNEKPLKHFNVIWPTQDNQIKTSIPQATTESGTLNYTRFKIDSKVLNLNNVDLVNAPDKAIISLDNAMSYISKGQIYIKYSTRYTSHKYIRNHQKQHYQKHSVSRITQQTRSHKCITFNSNNLAVFPNADALRNRLYLVSDNICNCCAIFF